MSLFEEDAEARQRLEKSLRHMETEPQSSALLAIHALTAQRWDDARRLIYQGYDAFQSAWARLPLLAQRARHERLSALPLLQTLEDFLDTQQAPKARPLSALHDRFSAWVDAALGQISMARLLKDGQAEAKAYANLGQRCREAKNLTAAHDLMKRCCSVRAIFGSSGRSFIWISY